MSRTSSLRLFGILMLIAVPGSASIISENIGSAPPFYQPDSASPLGDLLGVSAVTNGFVAVTDTELATIELPISILDLSEPNELHLSLTNDAGFTPGPVLESFDISGQMGLFGDMNPLIIVVSHLHPTLQSGTLYWIVATVGPDTAAAWNEPIAADLGPLGSLSSGGSWTTFVGSRDAFRVTGIDTPEPNPFCIDFIGLVVIYLLHHKISLRKKDEISENTI